ncbi:TPA: hypothetical protein SJ558_000357 [Yersinia enterocolitica]|nr:hypothetical protein [Yersinia enterocolitica]
MTWVTNLPGADLNAAGSGLNEARPMNGPSHNGSQRTCSLKYAGKAVVMHNIPRLFYAPTSLFYLWWFSVG